MFGVLGWPHIGSAENFLQCGKVLRMSDFDNSFTINKYQQRVDSSHNFFAQKATVVRKPRLFHIVRFPVRKLLMRNLRVTELTSTVSFQHNASLGV